MPVLVKICGLKTPEALDAALEAGADFTGFVFFEPSPRHVVFDNARALGAQVRGRARKVALTVDADDATFARIVETLQPDKADSLAVWCHVAAEQMPMLAHGKPRKAA